MILAGIDIGTNTLRLLIAETHGASFREIHSDRRITRLGQDLGRTGRLAPEAMERSLRALEGFCSSIRHHAVQHIAAVGTSALREASNTREFIHAVWEKTGLEIRVITGREEARLTLLGVAHALGETAWTGAGPRAASLIIDIGGGSTEFIIGRPGEGPSFSSLPLGAVHLTERFIKGDPPSAQELERMSAAIREGLAGLGSEWRAGGSCRCIGTAGTITTLAAVMQAMERYDPGKITGAVLTRAWVHDVIQRLGALTLEERRSVRGLERGREDIILAGAVITRELMDRFGCATLTVSDGGLREGIVLDLYDRTKAE
jgi:exopolyphosphatase/guanosine-5'-triphosphate,3'-diphosphate pyrophosphatase